MSEAAVSEFSVDGDAPATSLPYRVFAGVTWITLAGAGTRLLSLLSAPILTALVLPSEYGVVALVSTLVAFGSTLGVCGADFSYGRFWAGFQDSEHARIERFCWRLATAGTMVVAAAAGIFWWAFFGRWAALSPYLGLIVALGVVLSGVSSMSNVRARYQGAYSRLAASSMVAGALSAIVAVVLAVCWRADAWAILSGALIGIVGGVVVLGTPSIKSLLSVSSLDRYVRRQVLQLGAVGMTMAFAYWVISSADRWFIGLLQNQTEVGVYAFGSSIGTIGIVLNNAVTAAWFPEITVSYEKNEHADAPWRIGHEWARLVSALMLVWMAVASAGGDVICLLAHPRFHDGGRYVPWIAGGVFFYGLSSLANTGSWISREMRPSAYWWMAGALLSLAVNAVLVPQFGAIGAAITNCMTCAFIATGVLWSASRSFALRIPWLRLSVSAALVLAAGLEMTRPWGARPFYSLCLKFPFGLAVSLLVSYASAPDWTRRMSWMLGNGLQSFVSRWLRS